MGLPSELPMLELALRTCGAYRWNGFLTGENLRRIQLRCRELLDGDDVETQSRSLRVWNIFAHGSDFQELLLDSRLTSVCTAVLGPGYLLSDYSLNAVYSGAMPDPWHIDYPYSEAIEPVSSVAPLGLQCVMAIDAFDATNGATQFVLRSHTTDDHQRKTEGAEGGRRLFDGRPGDLLIMHAGTRHRAGRNTTAALRTGVVMSFVQRWVRPLIAAKEVAASLDDDAPDELRALLGAVVYEQIDGHLVRREVL